MATRDGSAVAHGIGDGFLGDQVQRLAGVRAKVDLLAELQSQVERHRAPARAPEGARSVKAGASPSSTALSGRSRASI